MGWSGQSLVHSPRIDGAGVGVGQKTGRIQRLWTSWGGHRVFLFSSETGEISFWESLGTFLNPHKSLSLPVRGNNNCSVYLDGRNENEMR